MRQELVAAGGVLEEVFWEAYAMGPSPEDHEGLRRAFARAYADRQRWLARFGAETLGRAETARLLGQSETVYVRGELWQYAQRYRSAALAGLGLTGSSRSEGALARIAADEEDNACVAAQEALRHIRERGAH